MGRKDREIIRLREQLEEVSGSYSAKLVAAENRAGAAEAKLKAVRKALGIEPYSGITIHPVPFSTSSSASTNPSVVWGSVRHIPPAA